LSSGNGKISCSNVVVSAEVVIALNLSGGGARLDCGGS
jgi:hypothetical protein